MRRVRTGVGYSEYPFLNHQLVEGADALATLQQLCTRDISLCSPGCGLYTLMLDHDGHPVDDGIVLRLSADRFVVTVPGRKPSSLVPTARFFDVKAPKPWLSVEQSGDVTIRELGAFTVVVQGPRSPEMLRTVIDFGRFPPWSVAEAKVGGVPGPVQPHRLLGGDGSGVPASGPNMLLNSGRRSSRLVAPATRDRSASRQQWPLALRKVF